MHLWIFWKAVCMIYGTGTRSHFLHPFWYGHPNPNRNINSNPNPQTLTLLGLMSHLRFYHATLSCNFMKWQICSVQLHMLNTLQLCLKQTKQTRLLVSQMMIILQVVLGKPVANQKHKLCLRDHKKEKDENSFTLCTRSLWRRVVKGKKWCRGHVRLCNLLQLTATCTVAYGNYRQHCAQRKPAGI